VISARAQKVAEWKDRKEAILRGEITASEEATDADVDSIYNVQEEASGIMYLHHIVMITCCVIENGCLSEFFISLENIECV